MCIRDRLYRIEYRSILEYRIYTTTQNANLKKVKIIEFFKQIALESHNIQRRNQGWEGGYDPLILQLGKSYGVVYIKCNKTFHQTSVRHEDMRVVATSIVCVKGNVTLQ